jgi:hypothetical protein
MKCVVITTTHKKHEFDNYDNIIGYIEDYKSPLLPELLKF